MEYKDFIIYEKKLPGREAVYADFPGSVPEDLKTCLRENGIHKLYSHQAEMYEAAERGENTVITTSTASGKTLSFLLPVLSAILKEPLTRAIFLYPTKALASDQFRALEPWLSYFGEGRLSAGVYDGDTLPAERSRIRKNANIILTNPEMLNEAFLPNHSSYGFDFLFANLKYIVIDELHSYRGAFGSHLANIFRRLKRITNYYHADPRFLLSSATIANPVELSENICGEYVTWISKDGSPAPTKSYRILEPPVIRGKDQKEYGRYSALSVAAEMLPDLMETEHHFIAFAKSRRNVEVLLKEVRDKLDAAGFLFQGDSQRIAGYRGGYTPLERKEIERKMISGNLCGLVSTNALELGIDIGSLDTTVLVGYPGTRSSFWQQSGRSGRGKRGAVNYLILENLPFDQYIAVDPEWLFSGDSEHAIVDRDNLLIQLAHIRAAAAEIPLSMDDIALFPALGEVIPVLLKAQEVKALGGKFAWSGPAFPAGDFSLRNMDKTRFKLILEKEGRAITEMDETQAYHELYPGAVYMHEGTLYEVLSLDLKSRTALCHLFEGNYYTVPAGTKETRILQAFEEETILRTVKRFGDINVNELISMFKKLQFHNHQNLGYVTLSLPLSKDYDTESTWMEIPSNVVSVYRSLLIRDQNGDFTRNNHFEGMANAIKNAAMMVTMASGEDIDVIISNNAQIPDGGENEAVFLFIYDRYAGGLGFSEKIYDLLSKIIQSAVRMVENCGCDDGCPACVGDYTLDKGMVKWGLKNLLKESEAPAFVKKAEEISRSFTEKAFSFFTLPDHWMEFCEAVEKNGESGGAFLRTVETVGIREHKLILTVENAFYAHWIMDGDNLRSIENILRYHVICPADMKIYVNVREDETKERKTKERLKRRYEDVFRNH